MHIFQVDNIEIIEEEFLRHALPLYFEPTRVDILLLFVEYEIGNREVDDIVIEEESIFNKLPDRTKLEYHGIKLKVLENQEWREYKCIVEVSSPTEKPLAEKYLTHKLNFLRNLAKEGTNA